MTLEEREQQWRIDHDDLVLPFAAELVAEDGLEAFCAKTRMDPGVVRGLLDPAAKRKWSLAQVGRISIGYDLPVWEVGVRAEAWARAKELKERHGVTLLGGFADELAVIFGALQLLEEAREDG